MAELSLQDNESAFSNGQEILPWLETNWQQLQLENKAILPHALLFSGVKGIGKSLYIQTIIQALLCQNQQHGLGCGVCAACLLYEANNHPDFRDLHILEDKKAIGIDQVREVINWFSLSHHYQQKKVLYIANPETLTENASNAILKTLEEPSAETVIILQTEYPQQLLATIRSRCVQYKLPKPSFEQALTWLKQHPAIEQQTQDLDVKLLLNLSFGAPFEALRLLEDKLMQQRLEIFEQLKSVILTNNSPLMVAKKLEKIPLNTLIYWMSLMVQDMIRINKGLELRFVNNQDLLDDLTKLSQNCDIVKLFNFYDEITAFFKSSLNSLNPLSILTSYLIQWQKCCLIAAPTLKHGN